MNRVSLGTVSGVAVMAAGLVAISALASSDAGTTVDAASPLVQPQKQVVVEAATPQLPGIDDSVQRVLAANGKLITSDPNSFDELVPEIARVLSFYGVTLTVPETPTLEVNGAGS